MIINCLFYAHDIMIWITRSLDLHSDNIITRPTTTTTYVGYGKKLRPNFAVVTKLWRWSDMGSTTPQAQDWSPSALNFLGKPPTYSRTLIIDPKRPNSILKPCLRVLPSSPSWRLTASHSAFHADILVPYKNCYYGIDIFVLVYNGTAIDRYCIGQVQS